MSDSCGAPVGGVALADVDAGNQAVIQGTVTRDGQPLSGAYARLLNDSDDFVGEVATGEEGTFRFFAADGSWKVRVLASKGFTGEYAVQAEVGKVIDLQVQA
ncbi:MULTISPECIES: DUF1416 domain-containing protein [Nocardiopsis]|uniref:DUF1416 domain-containing protein n=2 Tax=Nocardiopsis TaxID=2013 RepID=D7AWW9_NOCDD|nr:MULTISPECIES: DUF1416 domain-containing protein [Nocardiopsis]ADH69739.1 protein of unknown function DUF1416 [Nocardiopsis dassonvillei subsp. dassonvillei DSM 43111]ASU60682.1 DUF1416 domain-containing protein [Nocardiopsis dassonvillei]MCK9871241.1 DUF1416 domain-containing protein [Nocardiopsis dassonvillei]NKY77730.1 DUF1416 domain-containing protein [Nocardiopsis dassonvillei]NKY96270.1 DUF1416 domain-containing protein [Nocardiopsis alborubida]